MQATTSWRGRAIGMAAAFVVVVSTAAADVFHLGPGLTSLETVHVGNAGNAGQLSGSGAGGEGEDRITGGVDYGYDIGKYEVTAGQYTVFLNAVGGMDTYELYNADMWGAADGCKIERFAGSGGLEDPYQYRVAGDMANRPVNFVSWGDAARFANWLHNGQPTGPQDLSTTEDGTYLLDGATESVFLQEVVRKPDWKWAITSEDEWYKAAYHKNDGVTGNCFEYPTSSDSAPSRDLADVSGNNANHYGEPYPILAGYFTTVVGEFQNSESPYGTFDQSGNVWEWNEAIVQWNYRGLRGGSYGDDPFLDVHFRHGNDPMTAGSAVGFRVSAVPEPASALVLVSGVLMLLRRGR